jgi:site-specific recombinase XerD
MQQKLDIQLQYYLDIWLNELKMTDKSNETIKSYKNSIKSFINFIKYQDDNKLTLNNIKGSIIIQFLEYKNNTLQKQQEISIYTKKLLITHLKMFFSYIEQESDELFDFSEVFERIKIKIPKKEPKSLNKEDLNKLINFLENLKLKNTFTSIRNLLIVKSILYMGLRVSEMKSLKISDFKTSLIDDTLFEVRIIGKGNKIRLVYIKKEDIEDIIEDFKLLTNNNLICITKNQKQMRNDEIYKMIQSIYRQAKIDNRYNVHSLRHTYAIQFYQKTKNIVALQQLLGHSDIKTTMIYTQLRQENIANTVTNIDMF